ncbi:MAG: hypothetical protein C0483_17340 [Pirellula sp.]|nr:hypothetical protein [Pirellula sp.]
MNTQYQIKQLGIGGILDQAVQLLKNHFGLFFGIVAVTMIPAQVFLGLVQTAIATPEQIQANPSAAIVPIALSLVVAIFVFPLANAAVIYAVGSSYLSRPTSVGDCIKHGMKRWGALIWTSFLMTLAIGLGMILCIVPGIIFAFWFALAQEVAVLENSSGSDALSRSKLLMKGNIGTLFVMSLILGVINFLIGLGAQIIPQPHVSVIVQAFVQGFVTIFGTCALVVFYFSVRCKMENFDLQLLAEAVDDV